MTFADTAPAVPLQVRLLFGLINSVWRWYRPGGPHSLAEISDLVADACLRLVR